MNPSKSLAGKAANHETVSSAPFVPALELTAGQAPPIAANGGLSYMSCERDGDAGTVAAINDALRQIQQGEGRKLLDKLESAPPGPIDTKWGPGFRRYKECMAYIHANNFNVPPGGVALPLRYTIDERPVYTVVSSNALWRDESRQEDAAALRQEDKDIEDRRLYFPQVLRDARRIEEYYPGLSPYSAECMDKLGISLAHCESKCENFYDAAEVERVFYPEMEKLLLDFFPDASDAFVYNHDVFDKDYKGPVKEDQENKDPGVNLFYANLVHNDLNDNSGRVRCRELLTKNLRNFGRLHSYTEAEANAKMSRRFMSINLAKPMETVRQNPFVLCAWPSFAQQSYITAYRVYDDRVGETTRFTYRPDHEWYWVPQQSPTEVSMLKCYDSITDGSVSRWSFHSAAVDPTAPKDAPCRRNVVVRAFIFF